MQNIFFVARVRVKKWKNKTNKNTVLKSYTVSLKVSSNQSHSKFSCLLAFAGATPSVQAACLCRHYSICLGCFSPYRLLMKSESSLKIGFNAPPLGCLPRFAFSSHPPLPSQFQCWRKLPSPTQTQLPGQCPIRELNRRHCGYLRVFSSRCPESP